jgi:5-methylcytosine-specific restriction protein A
MPQKPKQYHPPGYEERKQRQHKAYETSPDRMADKRFYGSKLWRNFRLLYLKEHPWCVECEKQNRDVPAVHVDHIIDRKAAPDRAFDTDNVQSLCHACHSRKTARTGGWSKGR